MIFDAFYLIERKCINDLSISIIDGRFRDQKSRLIESNANVIYIIEGSVKSLLLEVEIGNAIKDGSS